MKGNSSDFFFIGISVLMIFAIFDISYAHLANYTFEELANKSDYIALGEVIDTKSTFGGNKKAMVKKIKSVKGEMQDKFIVKYGQPYYAAKEDLTELKTGEKYLFFIVNYKKEFYLFGIRGRNYYRIDKNNYIDCNNEKMLVTKCISLIEQITVKTAIKNAVANE